MPKLGYEEKRWFEVYERVKVVSGRRYRYLVKGFRVGDSVRQKVVKYLGPVDPVYKVGKRHKSNASVYARELSDEEEMVLKRATKSNNTFVRDRARIILLSSERFFARQISEKVGCEAKKVRKAIKKFNENGLEALQKGKAKGAIPKFTEAAKKLVLLHFSKKPRDFGYHFTTWTLPKFRKHLIDYGIVDSISIETVRQILFEAGARLKKSKRRQYSPDKDFDKKKLR